MPPGRLLLAFFIPILGLSNLLLLAQVPKLNAEGFNAAEIGLHQHLVFEMEQLKQHQVAHGTFFFGPHSHEKDVVSSYEPPLTLTQEQFLNDATINVEEEVDRCARYNFKISNTSQTLMSILGCVACG